MNHDTDKTEETGKNTTGAENDLPIDTNNSDELAEKELEPESVDKSVNEAAGAQVSAEEKLKAEVAELHDKYLRLYSEFDNMKRRNSKERLELMQTAGKDILVGLLPVVDDFERAMKAFENSNDVNALKEGVNLIYNKFLNTLTQKGVKPIESIGKDFDVDYHEAITKIPAPEPGMKGKVIDEVEKGYVMHDKVIRFAKVVVGE